MKQLIAAVAFFLVSSAQAGTITGFTGEYDVSNWTTTFTSPCNGCATIASATELTLVGADGAEAFDQFTDRTITVLTNAIITFSWEYETLDDPYWDLFGIIYNDGSGVLFTPLADETGGILQTGSRSFVVDAGDIFGFRVWSVDSINGAATGTISNFSVESEGGGTVPEPGGLALLGIALLGAAAARWRRIVS